MIEGRFTSIERFTGDQAPIGHLHPFGCIAYQLIPKAIRGGKLSSRSSKGVFLGYASKSKGYLILDPDTKAISVRRNVTFDDNSPGGHLVSPSTTLENGKDRDFILLSEPTFEDPEPIPENEADTDEEENESPEDLIDSDDEYIPSASHTEETRTDPRNITEALQRPDAEKWKEAIVRELTSLEENNTWSIVEQPHQGKLIGSTWTLKTKLLGDGSIDKLKARLCAQGFSQRFGRDYTETFSPTVRSTSLRVFLAYAASTGFCLSQADVKSAYLNAPVEETIHMSLPEGYSTHSTANLKGKCLRLNKSLYGLKQSGRNWYRMLNDWLLSWGLVRSNADPCVYVKIDPETNNLEIAILVHVDDIGILARDQTVESDFMKSFSAKFEISSHGPLRHFLNLQCCDTEDAIHLSQPIYIREIISRVGLSQSKTRPTPATKELLTKADCPLDGSEEQILMNGKDYPAAMGSLTYAAICTRPDIAFASSQVGRFSKNPGTKHWIALQHIYRYLEGTQNLGLKFEKGKPLELPGYSDSDWAGSQDDRRSTSGYLFTLGGTPISWRSRGQKTTANSSTEAEYLGANDAAKEAIFLRRLLTDLGIQQISPTTIYQDNKSCIAMTNNPSHHTRMKHIDVKHCYIRELVERKAIRLDWLESKSLVADIFTKPLGPQSFSHLRDIIIK